jgi:hypothetical protein
MVYGTPPKADVTYPDLRGTDNYFMWSDQWGQFISRPMLAIVCDECGEKYNDEWWTEDNGRDGQILVCECGQQFYQIID